MKNIEIWRDFDDQKKILFESVYLSKKKRGDQDKIASYVFSL